MCVSTGEPLAQTVGRLVRGRTVEGHQRGRQPGDPDDAGAPPIFGDGRDLEDVGLSGDGFVKAMYGCVHVEDRVTNCCLKSEVNCTYEPAAIKRSN